MDASKAGILLRVRRQALAFSLALAALLAAVAVWVGGYQPAVIVTGLGYLIGGTLTLPLRQ